MKKTSPAVLIDARACTRDVLGPLLGDLKRMRAQEKRRPGSTHYRALLAALADKGWPIPAISQATDIPYAEIQRSLAHQSATAEALPEGTHVPDYPDEITTRMRAMRGGPDMDPEVADFVRRLDAVGNADRARFKEYGGTPEEYDLLAATYTRDGLLGIGSAAIQREQKRGVTNGALARGLGRTYTALSRRALLTLDAKRGWVLIPSQEPDARPHCRFVYRADLEAARAAHISGYDSRPRRDLPVGRSVDLADVPTSPYQTRRSRKTGQGDEDTTPTPTD